jgi:hypothetical protein
MEAQVCPLVVVILRFIQIDMPLPPLKPMAQSRCGVIQILEVKMHLMVRAIPRSIQLLVPSHTLIEPLALRAAKALSVE